MPEVYARTVHVETNVLRPNTFRVFSRTSLGSPLDFPLNVVPPRSHTVFWHCCAPTLSDANVKRHGQERQSADETCEHRRPARIYLSTRRRHISTVALRLVRIPILPSSSANIKYRRQPESRSVLRSAGNLLALQVVSSV